MGWRGLAVAALLAVSLPWATAGADPPCDAAGPLLGAPTRLAQDDAGTGADASDVAAGARALEMAPPADGEQGEYYWAWLDPPVARDGADAHDWYAVDLAEGAKVVMFELVSNYTPSGKTMGYADFRATFHGPDGQVHSIRSGEGKLEFADAAGGRWLAHVTPEDVLAGSTACAPGAAGATPTGGDEAFRNHGLYVGCRPVCLERL